MAEKVTFDAENKLIILNNGVSACDAKEDIYSDWKEWFKVDDNAKYLQAFRTTGGDELTPGSYLGAYFFLTNGWRMRPYEDTHQLNVDGNLFVDGGGNPFVPTVGNYNVLVTLNVSSLSTNLVTEIPEIQYSSYNGGVTVDVFSSYSGTDYPNGAPKQPVNNMTDAIIIASERGFTTFYINGDITLNTGTDYAEMIFVGESKTKTIVTINSNADVENCEFYDAEITGTLDGGNVLKNCLIGDINYVNGYIEQCVLKTGTITLGGSAEAHFLDCWSGVVGSATPIIDMGGSGQGLGMRNYNGGIKLINKSGIEKVSIDLNSGHVVLDSTITNGEIIIRGIGKLTDNNNGANVNIQDFVNPGTIADATWNEVLSQHTSAGSAGEIIDKIKKLAALIPAGL